MRLYSRKNKELFDIFNIDIILPTFKWGTQPGNEWGNDHQTKFIDVKFNNNLIYRNDTTYWYFELTLLGFGFSITRQTGY